MCARGRAGVRLAGAAALCGALFATARPAGAADKSPLNIGLALDRGGWTRAAEVRPLGVGVPLREGQLRDMSGLSLRTDDGRAVPAVFEARRLHDDGSVQWLWADFQAPAASGYVLGLGGANPLPAQGVQVADSPGVISVSNGVLRVEWSKGGASPCRVWLTDGAAPEAVALSGDGAGVYLVTDKGERAAMSGPAAELKWTVEASNVLRATLLVEGWYAGLDSGERVARGRVRYHVHWGQPWIKMDHAFIVARSNDEVAYREIGVAWPMDAGEGGRARFGREGGPPLEAAVEAGQEAWIRQERFPAYHKTASLFKAGAGSRSLGEGRTAAGWCSLSNGRAGLVLAVKDFAPQFAKELGASRGGAVARLWSGGSGLVLDYRPRTLIEQWWGDWFHRIMETYCREGLPAELKTKEAWAGYNPSCVGLARSHELLAAYYRADCVDAEAPAAFAAFQTEPLVLPDPRWTCHVGAKTFWPMAAKGEGGPAYDDTERLISAWFDQYSLPQQVFPFTGWYDWGRPPVDRYAADQTGGERRVWAHWFRIGIVNRYLFNKYLMIAWARSGDRKYYEMGSRLNRFLRDYYILNWGERKGHFSQGTAWALPAWGGASLRPGVDSESMTGLALEYLLRGTEGCRDSIELAQGALLPAFKTAQAFTSTTPDMLMAGMIGMWRVTGDRVLRKRITELFRAWTNPEEPAGIRAEFFRFWAGTHYENPFYKLDRKVNAMVEYVLVFGDEADRRMAVKAARRLAPSYREGTEPIGYCNLSGAACGYAWGWEKDPELLATVKYQVEASRRMFLAFEKLPAEEKGLERWLSRASFSKSSYEASFAFPELNMVSGQKDRSGGDAPLRLGFTVSAAAAPLMSLPVSVGVLSEGAGER